MAEDETLVEIVARLERATNRLETMVDGDVDLGLPGMRHEQKGLREDVNRILVRLDAQSAVSYLAGAVMLIAAFALSFVEVRQAAGIPPWFALALVVILVVAYVVLTMSGVGLLRWFR